MKTNIIKSLSILLGTGILLVSSCKKEATPEPENPATPQTGPSAIGSFFSSNEQAAKQNFTINASVYSNITGAKGTKIYFPANTFKNASGAIVSGNIAVELIEVQTKGDMILLNKTTTSNGKLLVSGGELSVKAFQGTSQLTLATGASIYVQMPSTNPGSNSMILFSGAPTTGGDVNWGLTGLNTTGANTVQADSIGGGYSFSIGNDSLPLGDSLGWINVDYFAGYTTGAVTITTPANHIGGGGLNANTAVYVVFDNLNSIASLYSPSNGINTFTHSNLPIGMAVRFVAISEIGGQYYYSVTPATISANMTLTVPLNQTTLTALKAGISNL